MNLLKYFKRDPQPQAPPMACICPNCHHEDRRPKNLARKIGGALGAVAGAACGVYGILGTDRIGMDDVHYPEDIEDFRTDLISLAAATLRAIIGATTGCLVGIRLGELVDAHLLENQTCRQCGHPFGAGMDYVQRPTPFEAASRQAAGFARPRGPGFYPARFGEPPTDVDLDEENEGGEEADSGEGNGDFPSRLPAFGFGLGPQDLALDSSASAGPDSSHPPSPDSRPDADEGGAPRI
ncbi:MAG: hypothetical protein HYX42_08170 [Polaromonas sp.]|uniref:hypothetical protein n=1 Tax=Polaromonas sp. TaxID=1869339 RepID=UPI0025FC16AB|nr:hypothetical protein [Polaromonas sp.]MBI2726210.1 hypothetical protein [Polaromonas sp.]